MNNVSTEYLGDQKNDLPAMQIFERFEGDADDRAVIASYAAKDTTLPLQLLKKMAIFEDLTEMSNAVKVPVDYINFRGQQIRCFSCLFGKAREMGYSIPDDKAWTTEGKYEGATVLEPKKGAYFTPIAALDFASCEYSGRCNWFRFCFVWPTYCFPFSILVIKYIECDIITYQIFLPSLKLLCSVSQYYPGAQHEPRNPGDGRQV